MTKLSPKQKTIVESDVFKILNHQIDEHMKEIEWRIDFVKRGFDAAFKEDDTIRTRTSYENNIHSVVGARLHQLEQLADTITQISRHRSSINKIQILKLSLLNDYDFTHGDDTLQKEFFPSKKKT